MMLDHLGRHPDLFGFRSETYILPHYLLSESKYGDLSVDHNFLRLWNDMRAEYPFRRRNRGRDADLPNDWAETVRHAGGVFDRIMLEFAGRENKTRWCEKTPKYALHIDLLSRAFPGAQFIHMLRDGRDCAASDHRRWGRHPYGTMMRWKHVVSEGRRQGERIPDRYLEVRYEDVTNEPESEMRRVCSFLGVEFDKRILTIRPRPRNLGQASQSIVKNQSRSTRYFDDSRLRKLEIIAGMQLASFGYTTQYPDGDHDPGHLQRLWWFIHDSRAMLVRQLRNKLTVQKHMTWSLFLARLKSIVRHARTNTLDDAPGRRNSD